MLASAQPVPWWQPDVEFPVTVDHNAWQLRLRPQLLGPKTDHPVELEMLWDTGAFELFLPPSIASALGLVDLGSEQVQGIAGSEQTIVTKVHVILGGVSLGWCDATIGNGPDPLFGERLMISRNIAYAADPRSGRAALWLPRSA